MNKLNQKLPDIIILRIIALIMVVSYHCYCIYTPAWNNYGGYHSIYHKFCIFSSSIRLPLYTFISGYLFSYLHFYRNKYQKYSTFIENKVKRIIIPYIVFGGLYCWMFQKWQYFFMGVSHLWYLLMIFLCFLFWGYVFINNKIFSCKKSILPFILSIWIMTGIYIGLQKYNNSMTSIFSFQNFLLYGGYFGLGCYVAKNRFSIISQRINKIPNYLWGISFILIIISQYILMIIELNTSHKLHIIAIKASFTIITVLYFYHLLVKITRTITNIPPIINNLDKSSMGIYIFHHWLIDFGREYGNFDYYFKHYYILFPFLCFLGIFITSWGITYILQRIPLLRRLV